MVIDIHIFDAKIVLDLVGPILNWSPDLDEPGQNGWTCRSLVGNTFWHVAAPGDAQAAAL